MAILLITYRYRVYDTTVSISVQRIYPANGKQTVRFSRPGGRRRPKLPPTSPMTAFRIKQKEGLKPSVSVPLFQNLYQCKSTHPGGSLSVWTAPETFDIRRHRAELRRCTGGPGTIGRQQAAPGPARCLLPLSALITRAACHLHWRYSRLVTNRQIGSYTP